MRMRKIFTILMLLLLYGAGAYAQQTITGQVTTAGTGETLPYATVKVAGTTTGTLTDINGNYSIQVPSAEAILEISYIGYAIQNIKVGNNKVINIALAQDMQVLEGVVVTAMGIKAEKKSLGYAAQQVEGAELSNSKSVILDMPLKISKSVIR